MTYLIIVLVLVSCILNGIAAYPRLHETHLQRQKYRMEYDGWTLHSWMCGLYWFGLERICPKWARVKDG